MAKSFKVIEVQINEHDGISYDYVTRIDVDHHGKIVIITSPDVLDAMKFMAETCNKEFIVREQMLNLVKSYFPKNNYTVSYRTLTVEVK